MEPQLCCLLGASQLDPYPAWDVMDDGKNLPYILQPFLIQSSVLSRKACLGKSSMFWLRVLLPCARYSRDLEGFRLEGK